MSFVSVQFGDFCCMNFLGIFLAICCIVTTMVLEGTHPTALINLPAFLVVFGAGFFACFVQFPLSDLLKALKHFFWLISPPRYNFQSQAELLAGMSTIARQQGPLALENSVASASDDFTRTGIQMIVDGVDKDALYSLLQNAIELEQERMEPCVRFYESMGGYLPTMGIIGAVLGLIHAMSLLDRPDLLGPSIAVAFVATIYGLVGANIILIPTGNRIRTALAEGAMFKYMTLEGLVSIAAAENTLMLKRRIGVYTGNMNGD